MNKLANPRTLSFVAWLIVTILSVTLMPDLNQLVRDKGQITIPATSQSEVAKKMLADMDNTGGGAYAIIAVFNSGSDTALTAEQMSSIKDVIGKLKQNSEALGIREIVSHLDNEQVAKQFVSEDGTTILTQISVDKSQGLIAEVSKRLNEAVRTDGVRTYLTGTELVLEDFSHSTQEGVKKTEIIAVIFIIIVLIIVFRSPIVPLVSLLSVGVSYLVSMSLIAHAVDRFDYPFSNFTQVFLVVILFGIGTDYNILLFTRFKEELSRRQNTLEAVKETYRTAGRTVIYSGVAVFIGFAALILAEFRLYRASSAVGIGVAVLILVLYTLNPFFMALLGKKMFWPVKRFEGHGDSRMWAFLSGNAVRRPLVALIAVAVLCVPFVLKYSGSLSYNDLLEVDDSYASKQGINIIEKHYSPGFSSPATLVVRAVDRMDNQQQLQLLDELVEDIAKVDGVSKVYAPTRPAGEKIKELYINEQTGELQEGIGEAGEGIGKINEGISSAEEQFGKADGLASAQKLVDGTAAAKQGAAALGEAMGRLAEGIEGGKQGAQKLEAGLTSARQGVADLVAAVDGLETGYGQLAQGLGAYSGQFVRIGEAVVAAHDGFGRIATTMQSLTDNHPELAEDTDAQTIIGIASEGSRQLAQLSAELESFGAKHGEAMAAFREANGALALVAEGLSRLEQGLSQLQTGAASLQAGLTEGADGSGQISGKTAELAAGLGQINDGQRQLLAGLNELEAKMAELQSGLGESAAGLSRVSEGLSEAQKYLAGLSQSPAAFKFFVPQDVLNSSDFQQALDMYMSDDRRTATMTIILKVNPYSAEAMTVIRELGRQIDASLQGSGLSGAEIALGGKTQQNADLQDLAGNDFSRTATIMLIGIGLVLIFITRSLWQPVFIIGSLLLAYRTSLGIGEMIGSFFLDVDELSWNVPFFSFIMIVALGVDYSIFLMMRYRELEGDAAAAIVQASRHIGGVVISAAVILGGTFAALIPSGVVTLIEVAVVVMLGLFLLSVLMLPVLIPGLMSLVQKLSRFGQRSENK